MPAVEASVGDLQTVRDRLAGLWRRLPRSFNDSAGPVACERSGLLRLGLWLAWALAIINLVFSSTLTLGGHEEYGELGAYVWQSVALNAVSAPVALLFSLRFRPTLQFTKGLFPITLVIFALAVTLNQGYNARTVGCLAYLLGFWFALERPFFLSALFEKLMRYSAVLALGYGAYIAVLNWPEVRLDFAYVKASGEYIKYPFRNPNALCQVLDLLAVLVAARFLYARARLEKLFLLVPLVVLTNLILGTTSRGGILQLLVVWGIVLVASLYRSAPKRMVGFGLAGAAVATLVVFGLNLARVDVGGTYEQHFAGAGDSGPFVSRQVTVEAITQLLAEPKDLWIGKGAGSGHFVGRYDPMLRGFSTFSSHNSYVDMVAQFGLPMFLALVGFMLFFLVRTWGLVAGTRESFLWLLLVACGIHPVFEDYFFFRFGVSCDLIRFGLAAAIADVVWVRRAALQAAAKARLQAAAAAARELGLTPGGSPAR